MKHCWADVIIVNKNYIKRNISFRDLCLIIGSHSYETLELPYMSTLKVSRHQLFLVSCRSCRTSHHTLLSDWIKSDQILSDPILVFPKSSSVSVKANTWMSGWPFREQYTVMGLCTLFTFGRKQHFIGDVLIARITSSYSWRFIYDDSVESVTPCTLNVKLH